MFDWSMVELKACAQFVPSVSAWEDEEEASWNGAFPRRRGREQ